MKSSFWKFNSQDKRHEKAFAIRKVIKPLTELESRTFKSNWEQFNGPANNNSKSKGKTRRRPRRTWPWPHSTWTSSPTPYISDKKLLVAFYVHCLAMRLLSTFPTNPILYSSLLGLHFFEERRVNRLLVIYHDLSKLLASRQDKVKIKLFYPTLQ